MRTTNIYRAFLGLLVFTSIVMLAVYFLERDLIQGHQVRLETPKETPRAQAEFESGSIYRAYRESSEQELRSGAAPIDQVFDWMLSHPKEALK